MMIIIMMSMTIIITASVMAMISPRVIVIAVTVAIVIIASRLADAVAMGAMETAAADLEHYTTMVAVPSR